MGNQVSIADVNTQYQRGLWFYSCSETDRSKAYTISQWDTDGYKAIEGYETGHTQEEEGQPCAIRGLGQNYLGAIIVGSAQESYKWFEIKVAPEEEGGEEQVAECQVTVKTDWSKDVAASWYLGEEGGLFFWREDSKLQVQVDGELAHINCTGSALS